MKAIYTAVLTYVDKENGYDVSIPDIPGCVTTGKDLQDAIRSIADAANGCLCVLEDERLPLPLPSAPQEVSHAPQDFTTLIQVDTDFYRMRTQTQAVRKSVSMPKWMADMADRKGVNCSQLLQQALRQHLDLP